MRVLIAHQAVPLGAGPDEADVLVQVEAVQGALHRLGHECSSLGLTLDLEGGRRALERLRPELVFNLVESLDGSGRYIHFAPTLFEVMGLPYTGCGSAAIYETSNKLLAKRLLAGARLPTPGTFSPEPGGFEPGRYIIKSVMEHASVGLGDDAVIQVETASELAAIVQARHARLGGLAFAERYVEGREINVALLDGEVLPPDEIRFRDFPPEKPRIVGYAAKWDPGSLEYQHTYARAVSREEEAPLFERLSGLARAAWGLFELSGFARVDFRVDERAQPYILEVNANPCISPDAGFSRALERAGIGYDEAIRRIVASARPGAAAA